jgi:uncharacterized protein YecT (DUF1311 family)
MGHARARGVIGRFVDHGRIVAAVAAAAAFLSLALAPQTVAADNLEHGTVEYREADARLNEVYAARRAELGDRMFSRLRAYQRDWLERRDSLAAETARLYDGAPRGAEATSPVYWQTMTEMTRTRIRILEAWRSPLRLRGWEGEWIDGYGGSLTIVDDPDSEGAFLFELEVVRGATAHTGLISGRARTNDHLARYTDRDAAPEKPAELGETWLSFRREAPHLVVRGANTSWYHGARAYFSGRYIRVADVSEEARRRLQSALPARASAAPDT